MSWGHYHPSKRNLNGSDLIPHRILVNRCFFALGLKSDRSVTPTIISA
jgi:hypothetical protein